MRIAVVGAGIFGITNALRLSKHHEVHLFEQNDKILSSASSINQYRIHRGYHYPRSSSTVEALLRSVDLFVSEYKDAVIDDFDHYYFISNVKSKTTPKDYLKFCDYWGLHYDFHWNPFVQNVDLSLKVKESLIDPFILQIICEHRLGVSNVKVHLKTKFQYKDINDFDRIINCTYANLNEILPNEQRRRYQFELCEKIVVKMPVGFENLSLVIMDGPFMCVDPMGRSKFHVLGNVVHAIRDCSVGTSPNILGFEDVLNKGVCDVLDRSKFNDFIDSARYFIPLIEKAKYVGSMFTVRTVLPELDRSDARPTIVEDFGKIINVFSGKIDTCVVAAQDVERMVADNVEVIV